MRKVLISFFVVLFSGFALFAQTTGELTVSVATSSTGGKYQPKNIMSIWIEDADGNFVKTLLVNANKRKTHLNNWQASTSNSGSEYNSVDAISGATKGNHSTRTCSWNGTDYNKAIVTDGTYNLRMELTDKNSTGNYSSFSFTKGPNSDIQTPSNKPSFSSLSFSWIPTVSNVIFENSNENNYIIFPNPGNGIFKHTARNTKEVEIRNIVGKLITKSNSQNMDISNQKNGTYLIYFKTNNGIVIKKFIKQ